MLSRRVDMTDRLHFHFSLSCIGEGNGNPLQYSRPQPAPSRARTLEAGERWVKGKGLILPRGGNHVVFLELRRDSRVTTGISGFLLGWPWEAQSSLRSIESQPSTQGFVAPAGRPAGAAPAVEEMATHSSVLAWKIPWAEEPGDSPVRS